MNKQIKELQYEFKVKDQSEDNDFYYFQGYGSTFGNLDLANDIIEKGAFVESLQKKLPKMLFSHNREMPIGIFDEAYEDAIGLFVKGRIPKTVTFANDIGGLLKLGAIDSMSIGFIPKKYNYDDDGVCHMTECDLFEISLVTMPANPMAKVTRVKSVTPYQDLPIAPEETKWDKSGAASRVRKFTDSEEEPSNDYKKAFFWYDNENKDNYTGYKLPYADVIDGKLMAIPRAIFAVAAVLNGARGGVDIPDADKTAIKGIVNKYYKKMDMESPFDEPGKGNNIPLKEKVDIEAAKTIKSKRDFENVLRDSKLFTKSAAIYLASRFLELTQSESAGNDKNTNALLELTNLVKQVKEIRTLIH